MTIYLVIVNKNVITENDNKKIKHLQSHLQHQHIIH